MTVTLPTLLAECITHNASDLHLSADSPPMLRIDGKLRKLEMDIMPHFVIESLIKSLMSDEQYHHFQMVKELDFAFADENFGRFRVNCFHQLKGQSCVLRRIPESIHSFEQLGLPAVLKTLSNLSQGLVVVTGATGSGKSTTLATMIQYLNQSQAKHILTVEDPVEYVFQSECSLIQQRQVGVDTMSFQTALTAALREDPDVILIGELRDLDTIRLALSAAETGHLVLATLHTCSAARTVNRIVDVFPAEEQARVISQLAECLAGVVAQQLLPLQGQGRVGCFEVMVMTPAIANVIKERRHHQLDSMIQTGAAYGMCTMEQDKQRLIAAGYAFLE